LQTFAVVPTLGLPESGVRFNANSGGWSAKRRRAVD
jgi:hypothetical protein